MPTKENQDLTIEQLIGSMSYAFHNLEIKTSSNNIPLIEVIENNLQGLSQILNEQKNKSKDNNTKN